MMTSGRAAFASSGMISGLGLARANTIGSRAMPLSMSPLTIPPADSPMNTSAPVRASVSVRSKVSTANWALWGFMSSVRPR